MIVNILEMPAEGVWRVALDDQKISGYITLAPRDERYSIYPAGKDSVLRTRPQSREAAAMLLLFHHFTNERRQIEAVGAKRTTEKGAESE